MTIINAFTIDVEDYYQVSAFEKVVNRKDWGNFESRVFNNTLKILDLLEIYNTKATFFVLGCVAEREPQIVKEIYNRGHEVASHGYSHKLIYNQTQNEFREETFRSKCLLEDISGCQVNGYRAASYSITNRSLWALDVIAELGFDYDSSVFPVRHDRYGIIEAPRYPHILKTQSGNIIKEFPMSTFYFNKLKIPVSGGGYFRIFPYLWTKHGLNKINRVEKKPFIFYLHPWEIDPGQPKIEASMLSTFRHYTNISRCEYRLTKLLNKFKFSTVSNVLDSYDMPEQIILYK